MDLRMGAAEEQQKAAEEDMAGEAGALPWLDALPVGTIYDQKNYRDRIDIVAGARHF